MSDLSHRLAEGVFFVSPEGLLTHNAGCLMEGLQDLNVPVYTNAADLTSRQVSMPLKGQDLAKFKAELHGGYAAYIVDITHSNAFVPLEGVDTTRLAYLNTSDSSVFSKVPDDFHLFSTHENRFVHKGGKRHAIAFGPSNWLIAQTENQIAFSRRAEGALRNFRPTLSQGVRALLDLSFVPLIKEHLNIDGTIYAPKEYLSALTSQTVCLAYGGDFYSPIMNSDWFSRHQKDMFDLHTFERMDHDALVFRWDSWRFWESMVSGCVTVHLDFEKYGFDLPVLPKAWVHYVPIDLDDIRGSAEALLNRRAEWSSISEQGRAWAIEHYAPAPAARRIFETLLRSQD